MAIEIDPVAGEPVTLRVPAPATLAPIAQRVRVRVVNVPNFQEATLRKVITPRPEIDQATAEVVLVSQGLSLTEERRTEGQDAILIEIAARYRRGEGAIKQLYRYLVFQENGTTYCQRLPMGAWAPGEPDECFAWLGRGGLQQGDFVLLPRKRLPAGAERVPRPRVEPLWRRAIEGLKHLVADPFLEEPDDWTRMIGRHDPVGCEVHRKEQRLFLVAPEDTRVEHPEHATLTLPAGVYEIVEDRASSYWRKAID